MSVFQFWFPRCVCPAVGLVGHMTVFISSPGSMHESGCSGFCHPLFDQVGSWLSGCLWGMPRKALWWAAHRTTVWWAYSKGITLLQGPGGHALGHLDLASGTGSGSSPQQHNVSWDRAPGHRVLSGNLDRLAALMERNRLPSYILWHREAICLGANLPSLWWRPGARG